MVKKIINSERLGVSTSPLSHANVVGDFVFTSGQVASDPETGEPVGGGIEAQTKQALENLQIILEAAGTNLGNVVKTTVFMVNIDDFQKMNEIYSSYFSDNPPARSCIEVSNLASEEWIIEIEAVATQ